jgi:hypothetical protein
MKSSRSWSRGRDRRCGTAAIASVEDVALRLSLPRPSTIGSFLLEGAKKSGTVFHSLMADCFGNPGDWRGRASHVKATTFRTVNCLRDTLHFVSGQVLTHGTEKVDRLVADGLRRNIGIPIAGSLAIIRDKVSGGSTIRI